MKDSEGGSLKDFKFSTPPRCIEAEQKKRREHLIAALGLDPYYMDEGVQKKTEEQRAILRERLAAYAHDAWSRWMRYEFEVRESADEKFFPSNEFRWERQMNTPYAELPEAERASDRAEADRILAILCGEI